MYTNYASDVALSTFAHAVGIEEIKKGVSTLVTAVIGGETKYERPTEVFYSTANKYGNPEISIYWDLPTPIRNDLGLYGSYSSVFNDFSFDSDNKELIINVDSSIIYISSKHQ